MRQPIPHKNAPRILIIIPGGVNYFYDAIGRRFASAFRDLGCSVDVCRLGDYQIAEYDIVLYVNLSEISQIYAWGYPDAAKVRMLASRGEPDLSAALRQLEVVQRHAQRSGLLLSECVHTHWFAHNHQLAQSIGVNVLYDVGFHSQAAALNGQMDYCLLFNALTGRERERVTRLQLFEQERPIPWAFVGHISARRLEFAYELIKRLETEGVFYLPHIEPVTPDGPHFNATQLQRLLEKTRYYIWISHHDYFYIESERFRDAFLAGCVPIKVQTQVQTPELSNLPFNYLLLNATDFDEHLQTLDYAKLRWRFLKDYLAYPSLEAILAQKVLQLDVMQFQSG